MHEILDFVKTKKKVYVTFFMSTTKKFILVSFNRRQLVEEA